MLHTSKSPQILVCYHQDIEPIRNPVLRPIMLGAATKDVGSVGRFDFLDNQGEDNISKWNPLYAELTAHYFAYRNLDAPAVGLFHYRRLLDFSGRAVGPIQNIGNDTPENIIATLQLTPEALDRLLEDADILLPEKEKIHDGMTVLEHYSRAHRRHDLLRVTELAETLFPSYGHALRDVLDEKEAYYCNMFVMRRELFREYSEMLFGVLDKYRLELNLHDHALTPGGSQARVIGFLAERMLTAYVKLVTEQKRARITELPRVVLNFKKEWFYPPQKALKKATAPKVSVVFPVYNVAQYLPHAFQCLRGQSLTDLEILVVNDGSTDESSAEVINRHAALDPRIQVITQKNAGLGPARNTGLRAARGEYVHFFDPDDFIAQDFLEQMYHLGSTRRADIVIGTHYTVDEHVPSWDDSHSRPAFLFPELQYGPDVFTADDNRGVLLAHTPVWDKLWRREFLAENAFEFPHYFCEDIPFTWQTYTTARRMTLMRWPRYYYRNRAGSLTNSSYRTFQHAFIVCDLAEKWLREKDLLQKYLPEWNLKKWVNTSYAMVKIPHIIQRNPSMIDEYTANLTAVMKSIEPKTLSRFERHVHYGSAVAAFRRLAYGHLDTNIREQLRTAAQRMNGHAEPQMPGLKGASQLWVHALKNAVSKRVKTRIQQPVNSLLKR